MTALFAGKRILVTGACGTVGREIVRQLLTDTGYAPEEVIGLDNNEGATFFLDQAWLEFPQARFFVADVRHRDELERKFRGIDLVFHAAALKHVVLCERSPEQAVETNILGIQNVIAAANSAGVERVIFTSSDKAVNPTNVMGTSKLMGERLITAANSSKRDSGQVLASTRFGNVLGSSGSVIPVFHNQIAKGGPVTLTDHRMTRFVMSVAEAVKLVIHSACKARGGEVFITKMPVVRIPDLARAMIEVLAPQYDHDPMRIEMIEIGAKPGEKLYEELMNTEEVGRTCELDDYFAVLPAFRGIYHEIDYDYADIRSTTLEKAYVSASEEPLKPDAIKAMLAEHHLLEKPDQSTAQRYWPGDKEQKS